MKPDSSISGSSLKGHLFAPLFFLAGFLLFQVFNFTFFTAHAAWRRDRAGNEWTQKKRLYLKAIDRGPVGDLFLGDSTVMVGIQPSLVSPAAFNLGVGGLDPSELALHARFLQDPKHRPARIFLSISPNYLSGNEWKNPVSLPKAAVVMDASLQFYADQNSFRPVLLWGARPVKQAIEKIVARVNRLPDEFVLGEVEADGGMLRYPYAKHQPALDRSYGKFRTRLAGLESVGNFVATMRARGVPILWIHMPYRENFEEMLRDPSLGAGFATRRDAYLTTVFGDDIIDMRGSMPSSAFRDDVHLTPEGSIAFSRLLAERVRRLPRPAAGLPIGGQ